MFFYFGYYYIKLTFMFPYRIYSFLRTELSAQNSL